MLSRVAESLYWMARNVERAEDLARLIDVTATRSVDRFEDAQPRWHALYTVAGVPVPEEGPLDRTRAIDDVVFDSGSRFSIAASVRIARQNAVGVRAELTTEVWECINGLYLFVEAQSARAVGPDGTSTFLRSVRDTAQAFGGICDATLAHDDAWEFLRIGRFLERARMTSRILRAADGDVGPHVWQLTLEACCASAPFARARRQSSDPVEALAFLALSPVFPRSLRFCAREVDAALHSLSGAPSGTFADDAERLSGRIAASLDFAGAFDLVREGPRAFSARLATELDALGGTISTTYFPAVPVG
jgi:uncharacterized alpha-E superfamily protein